MNTTPQILICDDDQLFHVSVKHSLKGRADCRSAMNGDEALLIIKNHRIDLLLLDIHMRNTNEGLQYIPKFKNADPDMSIVIASGSSDFKTVREAMRLGAMDYVHKGSAEDELYHAIQRVLEQRKLQRMSQQRSFEVSESQRKQQLIGSSQSAVALRRSIDRVRGSPANVLITGETGTGKEIVARQLRRMLPDGTPEPFVAVDSSTIQSSTAESILFGHEKGAFTGAEKSVKGIFEEADGGVVYFDEIANMPLEIQGKLLRVLQEKEICRLGSTRSMKLEFRVLAATNRDLEELCKTGQFKYDLFQRLSVLPLAIPPLRERQEDIPALLNHFAAMHAPGRALGFTREAVDLLGAHTWPGNIRELANVVAYVAVMSDSDEIDVADLTPKLRDCVLAAGRPAHPAIDESASFYDQISVHECEILRREYAKHGGNVSKMSLALGMDRSHLYTKLREHGIHGARPAVKGS